jgi:alkylation response protein AidB-like acyl-CoA dehydrogenase
MRKVTQEEFYKKMGPLDVTVTPEGNYPYKTFFKLRRGGIVGMIVDREYGGLILEEHFLSDSEARRK